MIDNKSKTGTREEQVLLLLKLDVVALNDCSGLGPTSEARAKPKLEYDYLSLLPLEVERAWFFRARAETELSKSSPNEP